MKETKEGRPPSPATVTRLQPISEVVELRKLIREEPEDREVNSFVTFEDQAVQII
jgi:hypothetical protein